MLHHVDLRQRPPTRQLLARQKSFSRLYEIPTERISGTNYKIFPLRRVRRKTFSASLSRPIIRSRFRRLGILQENKRRPTIHISVSNKYLEEWLYNHRKHYLRKRCVCRTLRNKKNKRARCYRALSDRLSHYRKNTYPPARIHNYELKTGRLRRSFLSEIYGGLIPSWHLSRERTRMADATLLRQTLHGGKPQ